MASVTDRRGPLAAVDRTLDGLSPRDRRLLVGLVLFFLALMTFGYWWFLRGFLDERASRVIDAKAVHAAVVADSKRLAEANAQFARQEGRLHAAASQPVPAWIEELAKRHELDQALSKVTDTNTEVVGSAASAITQTHYTVELKKAPQEQLYRFLYDMETSDFPASIESAKLKVAMVKKEKFLDVSLDIVVLSVGEG